MKNQQSRISVKKQILTALALISMIGAGNAEVLFSSDFDGNTGAAVLSGDTDNTSGLATVTINDWSTDASVAAITGLTAISTTSYLIPSATDPQCFCRIGLLP